MKDRGKAVEAHNNIDMEFYSSSEMPCSRHPNSSSVGICAYCLKERLVKLVCSDCGEQRLSSCSCSEISSNRNSCTVEVGSVGRVSFLIENEKHEGLQSNSKPSKTQQEKEDVVVLRRSSSSCVGIKRSGFWGFGRLFRKKRSDKDCGNKSVGGFDERSEMWLVDHMGVSRSRSLCSFRGGGFFESEDGGEHLMVSGARSSISAARSSSVTTAGMVLDSGRKSGFSEGRKSGFSEGRKSGFSEGRKSGFSEGRKSGFSEGRKSGFSEAEPRKSGFDGEKKDEVLVSELGNDFKGVKRNGLVEVDKGFSGATRRVFSLKESDFSGMDDSGFIDLKLDYSADSKPDFSAMRVGSVVDRDSVFGSMRGSDFVAHECGGQFRGLMGDGIFSHGGSCRITVNDRGIKRGRKSLKGWKWIFRHHPSWGSTRKKDEDLMFKT